MVLDRTQYTLRCEWIALWLLTLCAFTIPISVSATTITYFAAWLFILIAGQWQERWLRILSNPVALSFWILFALFVIGLFYSASPWYYALKDLQKRHWLLITPFFMSLHITEQWRQRITQAFLIAMIITLILSYLKSIGVDLYFMLLHRTLTYNNVFFEHVVQNFFMSYAAFIFGYRFLHNPNNRWFNLAVFTAMAINIFFLNEGRTGHIVFLLLIVYLAWIRFNWRGLLTGLFLGMLLFSSAFLSSTHLRTSVTNVFSEYHQYHQGTTFTSIGQRMGMLHNALALIKKHPWLGYGTGGIRIPMQSNLTAEEIKLSGPIDYVENSLLNFWLEFGFFGAIIFLGCIAWQIKMGLSLRGENRALMQAFLLAYLAGSLVNCFFVSFCETHFYSLVAATFFSALAPVRQRIAKPFTTLTTVRE